MKAKHKRHKSPSTNATSTITSPRRLWMIDVAVALATLSLIGISIWFNASRQQPGATVDCAKPGNEHRVTMQSHNFSPNNLTVKLCDRVIVSNLGDQSYDLAFGTHDNLVAYPGFSRQSLRPGEYFELVALKPGQHTLHDHTGNKAYLELTVSK